MLAMEANDDAGCLNARGVRTSIASMLAPTGSRYSRLQRPLLIALRQLPAVIMLPILSVSPLTLKLFLGRLILVFQLRILALSRHVHLPPK